MSRCLFCGLVYGNKHNWIGRHILFASLSVEAFVLISLTYTKRIGHQTTSCSKLLHKNPKFFLHSFWHFETLYLMCPHIYSQIFFIARARFFAIDFKKLHLKGTYVYSQMQTNDMYLIHQVSFRRWSLWDWNTFGLWGQT